jgi:hypothetical protein
MEITGLDAAAKHAKHTLMMNATKVPSQPRGPLQRRSWRRYVVTRLAVLLGLLGLLSLLWITGCMERLFYHPTRGSTPAPSEVPGAESVWFNSADGTRLHGWWLPAARKGDHSDDPAPTILHVHGNAGNIVDHRFFTEHLPPAGFNVFLFDYRGYGQSEGSAWKRGPLIADADAALDVVLARPEVDPRRIGVYGQSLGGAIALNVMAARPEIHCAVIESGFTSWREIAANVVGGDPPNFLARGLAGLLISDSDRPIDAIVTINRPVLLLHGDADGIIPVSHSRRLRTAGAENVELIELSGGEHNSLRWSHPEIDRIEIEFLRRSFAEPVPGAMLRPTSPAKTP